MMSRLEFDAVVKGIARDPALSVDEALRRINEVYRREYPDGFNPNQRPIEESVAFEEDFPVAEEVAA